MSLHIYDAPGQPMTRYNLELGIGDEPLWVQNNPRGQFVCHTCGQRRWAKNLRIKVFYDSSIIFCAEGHMHQFGDRRRRLVPKRGQPHARGGVSE